jgi:hypothetical protein
MPSGWPPITAETALARALDGHYARAGDEAYLLIREALTAFRRHLPRPRPAAHPARPAHRTPAHQALAVLCDLLTAARARYPGTDLVLRYEVKSRPIPA